MMVTNSLSLNEVRAAGFPGYSLNMEEKWHQMRLLLNYDRTRLIEGDIVGQSMHGLTLGGITFPTHGASVVMVGCRRWIHSPTTNAYKML